MIEIIQIKQVKQNKKYNKWNKNLKKEWINFNNKKMN